MSKTTIALEAAVAAVIENMPKDEADKPGPRRRHEVDKAFTRIMKLIAPRIRHFIRQYGLVAYWEDAEQACAIAVHRAIQSYDPTKAQFTTFVNWQIRGELQSLRFRVMTDQRPSAQKVEATTVSINSIAQGPDGDETTLEAVIQDENAHVMAESGAADYLATGALHSLIDSYVEHLRTAGIDQLKRRPRPKRPPAPVAGDLSRAYLRPTPHGIEPQEIATLEQRLQRDREIIERRLFDAEGQEAVEVAGVSKERARQISKRAIKTIGEIAGSEAKFRVMADYRRVGMLRSKARTGQVEGDGAPPAATSTPVVILPDAITSENDWSRVAGADFDPATLDAGEIDAGAAGLQSMLRH